MERRIDPCFIVKARRPLIKISRARQVPPLTIQIAEGLKRFSIELDEIEKATSFKCPLQMMLTGLELPSEIITTSSIKVTDCFLRNRWIALIVGKQAMQPAKRFAEITPNQRRQSDVVDN